MTLQVTPPAGGGSGPQLQLVQLALTHAEILTLPNNPIELVAAPGANRVISPILPAFVQRTFQTAYGNVGGLGDYYMHLIAGSSGYAFTEAADVSFFFGDTFAANRQALWAPVTTQTGSFLNQALVFEVQGDGDFTGGHADNVLSLAVAYLILDV